MFPALGVGGFHKNGIINVDLQSNTFYGGVAHEGSHGLTFKTAKRLNFEGFSAMTPGRKSDDT